MGNEPNNCIERFFRLDRLTFQRMNIFVAAAFVLSLGFLLLVKAEFIASSPTHRAMRGVSWSPADWTVYNLAVAGAFAVVYRTRHAAKYYHYRAFVYGMLMGGVAGEMMLLFRKFVLHL